MSFPAEADLRVPVGLSESLPTFRTAVAEVATDVADRPLDARALWRGLGARGLIADLFADGAAVPASDRLAALLEELDARLPFGLVLSVCVQAASVVPLLVEALGAEHPLAAAALRGETVIALDVTDSAAAGSDVLGTATAVTGDQPVITGGKRWITNAVHCDHHLVLVRRRAARHFTSFSWIAVPAEAAGLRLHPVGEDLFPGAGLAHVEFDSVSAPAERAVGPAGRGLALFARHVATERLAGALWSRAMCRRVLAGTRDWLAARRAGDATLWHNDAVRRRFGDCLVEFARLDALCDWVCDRPDPARAMALKAAAGQGALRILRECADLRGAEAFADGGQLLAARATAFAVAGGATDAMLAGLTDHVDELLRS